MEQYLIYLRKSRSDIEAETRGEGETLARHKSALLALAKQKQLHIGAIYEEIVSGENIASRPKMQQLLTEVENGLWAGVIVMEVERLARGDTMDQGLVSHTFKYGSTKIITPNKIYDPNNEFDEEYFEFGLFMSRREYKTINRRLQNGRIASVKEGKYVGNKTPYGYTREKLINEKGFMLKPIPEQAEIVKMIFELYVSGEHTGMGVSRISRRLNDMGIKPLYANNWIPATIKDMLCNPVYIGKIRWGRRPTVKKMIDGEIVKHRPRMKDNYIVVDGLHEPLISEELFKLAQSIIDSNPTRPVHNKGVITNPFAGLVVCGICGKRMQRRPGYKYVDCLICNTACANCGCTFSVFEDVVLKELTNWLESLKVDWKENKKNDFSDINKQKSIIHKSYQKEINDLKAQLVKCYELLERSIYSEELFFERQRDISEKLIKKEKNLLKIKQELNDFKEAKNTKDNLIPKLDYIVDYYRETENAEEKNKLLKTIISKIIYTRKNGGRWAESNDNFHIEILPVINK